ncbi:hypothetical protein E4656_13825 [Natronospirillum operosum]|uniref:Phage tail fibre protein N-terminal domain-containing protein n=1 Tax=Natronospirillum operosum TaxID=2759953 RepID=A0A4Z0WEF4_9GAMM|nr:phage tail protein [Natronospirillum operosum]TGG92543.1 hypothetical protein E4656_13825 [Natronospirillum operosum]
MGLKITITDAGRAEVINATNTGTAPVEITEVALGSGGYEPNPEQVTLQNEQTRLSTIAGEVVSSDTIHVTVKDESSDAYDVQEFGLYTEHGTLFAVYSDPEGPFMQKASASSLLLSVDVILGTLNATNLTFGDTSFSNPPASETLAGVLRLATEEAVLSGSGSVEAVTPATLNARTATTERTGLAQLATDEQALAGTGAGRALQGPQGKAVAQQEVAAKVDIGSHKIIVVNGVMALEEIT